MIQNALILASSDESDDVTLSTGSHTLPFKFNLPVDLPASYHEPDFVIRHLLKAVLDRPGKFNKEFKMDFTVGSDLDLNTIHTAAIPLEATTSKTSYCFGCGNDGVVTAAFRIDKSGYVPGEEISIHGEVHDGANVGINETLVNFVRRSIYIAGPNLQRAHDIPIGSLRHDQVGPNGSDVWNGEKLQILPTPPSYLAGCKIIDLQYYLEVTVYLGNCCTPNLKLTIPVIIGTVPLHSTVQQNATITHQPQGNMSAQPAVGALPASAPVNLPPPSYQENNLLLVKLTTH